MVRAPMASCRERGTRELRPTIPISSATAEWLSSCCQGPMELRRKKHLGEALRTHPTPATGFREVVDGIDDLRIALSPDPRRDVLGDLDLETTYMPRFVQELARPLMDRFGGLEMHGGWEVCA